MQLISQLGIFINLCNNIRKNRRYKIIRDLYFEEWDNWLMIRFLDSKSGNLYWFHLSLEDNKMAIYDGNPQEKVFRIYMPEQLQIYLDNAKDNSTNTLP